jgi:hypothetical protein
VAPSTPFAERAWEAYVVLLALIVLPAVGLLGGYGELSARKEHDAFLARLNGLSTGFVLEVDGSKVDDPGRIVADLKRLNLSPGEHAPGGRPTWYRIEITDDRRTLRLLLARPDSALEKYWVFLPPNDSEPLSPSADPPLGTRIGGFFDPELAALLALHERR